MIIYKCTIPANLKASLGTISSKVGIQPTTETNNTSTNQANSGPQENSHGPLSLYIDKSY